MLKSNEFAKGWAVIAGTIAGLAVGAFAVNVFALSILLKPTSEATGLSRSTITFALFIGTLVTMLVMPVYGRLIDRYGVKTISIPAIIAWAITFSCFALLSDNASWLIVLLFALSGIFSVAQTTLPYSKAITSWFDAKRGLALGIGVSGVGVGGFLMPQYVQFLNGAFGWRLAYVGVGLAILIIAVPAMGLLVSVKESAKRDTANKNLLSAASTDEPDGIAPALRQRQFWLLAVIFFVSILALNGTLTNLVALLTDRGLAPKDAASVLSVAGVALIAGRVICGYLLDKFHGPYVACAFLVLPTISIIGLIAGVEGPMLALCAIGLGMGIGGEIDVLGYLTSRYFKLTSFGSVYGALFSLVTLGTALGPYLMGLSHDRIGDYQSALICAALAVGACAVLSLTLGPYPKQTLSEGLRNAA